MLLFLSIYAVWCIAFAWVNSRWINQDNKFSHAANGAIHVMTASFAALHTKDWTMFFLALIQARLVFTIPLNLFRKLDWNYVTATPKAMTDKTEQFLFGKNGTYPVIAYLVLCGLILYFKYR